MSLLERDLGSLYGRTPQLQLECCVRGSPSAGLWCQQWDVGWAHLPPTWRGGPRGAAGCHALPGAEQHQDTGTCGVCNGCVQQRSCARCGPAG